MNDFLSQTDLILADLEAGKEIDQLSALENHGVIRLPARIHELKKRGHRIAKEFRAIDGSRFAVYTLLP